MAFGEFFFVEVQKSSCLSKRDEVFFFFLILVPEIQIGVDGGANFFFIKKSQE
jgi:hypothetical protein